jgi:phosphatidylserine decarboxylase
MALRDTITNGVNKAFSILDNLAVDVTFNLAQAAGYDFTTGVAATSSDGSVTVRGIVINDEKEAIDGSGISTKLIVKKADISGNINLYSTFTIDGTTYALSQYEDNGFAIEINMRGAV